MGSYDRKHNKELRKQPAMVKEATPPATSGQPDTTAEKETSIPRSGRLAQAALKQVQAVDGHLFKDYKTRADGFPVMVMQAGLAQAVGFYHAKTSDKHAYGRYLEDFAQALAGCDGATLLSRVIQAPLPEYRRLTREALDLALWFKRFCQAKAGEADAHQETTS